MFLLITIFLFACLSESKFMAMSLSTDEKMKLLARYGTSCWRKDCEGPPGCLMRHVSATKSTPETVMDGHEHALDVDTVSMSSSTTVPPATKSYGRTPPCCVRVWKDSFEHWSSSPDHLYIGRDMTRCAPGAVSSKWENPFPSQELGVEEWRGK